MIKKFLELFDFKNWTWIKKDSTIYVAEFYIKDIRYQCTITKLNDAYDVWDLSFYKIDKNLQLITSMTDDFSNSSKVLSNIKSIVEDYITQHIPNILLWKSTQYKRHGLYRKLSEHLANDIAYNHGFKFYENSSKQVYWISKYSDDKTNRIINDQPNLFDKFI